MNPHVVMLIVVGSIVAIFAFVAYFGRHDAQADNEAAALNARLASLVSTCVHPLSHARFDGIWQTDGAPLAALTCLACGTSKVAPVRDDVVHHLGEWQGHGGSRADESVMASNVVQFPARIAPVLHTGEAQCL